MNNFLPDLFNSSKRIYLDLGNIPDSVPDQENMKLYFTQASIDGIDPTSPENRQAFNDHMIQNSGYKYLIGGYAEDRSYMLKGSQIYAEGRTYHLGIDIFCTDLETIHSPCDGMVVASGKEQDPKSYGNYLIIKPDDENIPLIFMGHLSDDKLGLQSVKLGDRLAEVGDYINNENGGWSRHIHLQMINRNLDIGSSAPPGYCTKERLAEAKQLYPDPLTSFDGWAVQP